MKRYILARKKSRRRVSPVESVRSLEFIWSNILYILSQHICTIISDMSQPDLWWPAVNTSFLKMLLRRRWRAKSCECNSISIECIVHMLLIQHNTLDYSTYAPLSLPHNFFILGDLIHITISSSSHICNVQIAYPRNYIAHKDLKDLRMKKLQEFYDMRWYMGAS